MWYFPENLPDLWGCGGVAPALRMMFLERIPTLTEEELNILVDIFLSIR
jgi:hypothetical protein